MGAKKATAIESEELLSFVLAAYLRFIYKQKGSVYATIAYTIATCVLYPLKQYLCIDIHFAPWRHLIVHVARP